MSQIVWTQSAIDDLNRHYDFIKLNNPDAAAQAVQAIVSSGESLPAESSSRRNCR
ncbi:type II toxin-antitoxin system RelE/ParE family toxin [Nostoc sp. ATCC 53789]|uniref:type II toxin-antitoxin system RelE/ParE family toxin n=1 Tax=Nostoc sp. ATCC 53789 TaxID=76335 RepID=UPI001FD7265A|nr:type II toxin-antitoxin system RelE/ParE family toxin [Nostoc sp. ATCC 53789]